jgi:MerR family Zn(II)-responsive transcriptional regulator of zntA
VPTSRPKKRLATGSAVSGEAAANGEITASGDTSSGAPKAAPSKEAGELFTTGDMARLTDSTLRTVRFYEEAGILRPARRTEGGHRLFAREELERLRLVSDMREAGLSLDDIRSLLELKSSARSGGDAARGATAALKDVVVAMRTKMTVLARLSEDLERTVHHAEACRGCEETDGFPRRCNECHRLLAKGPVPRGLRVLWGLSETVAETEATEPPPGDSATAG